jgi:hypothetical protein
VSRGQVSVEKEGFLEGCIGVGDVDSRHWAPL